MDRRQLPEGWKVKKLGEVINLEYGKPLSNESRNVSGKYPAYGANGVKCWSDEYYFDKPSIIVGRKGSAGEVNLTTERFWPLDVTYFVTYDDTQYDLIFLYHCLKHLQLTKLAKGVKPGVNRNDVYQIKFLFPPLDEQKQIVAILDEAFEGINQAIRNTEKNLANAHELFESFLNFKLLPIASGHLIQTLACITDLIVDCEHKTAPTQEVGIPSIRTPNIGKGYLIFDNVNRVSEETYELWTKRAKPISGDLILAREAPAGNVGIIPQGERVCLGQRTVLIRPKQNRIDSQFLAFLLLHPLIQKRLLAKSTGATVQHVNMKDIRELKLSELPSIEAQQKLTKELEDLRSQGDRLETIYRQKIAALNELKQSILQKAFTGQLTKKVYESRRI
jgi:type I restriction enzyme S subunit